MPITRPYDPPGGIPLLPEEWTMLAEGRTDRGVADISLEPGQEYRVTVTLPVSVPVPEWLLQQISRALGPKVIAVTALGNEIAVYIRG